MEGSRDPGLRGGHDHLSEPPEEMRTEIQAGLDDMYRPDVETDELGPEISLTQAQCETAVCRYIAQRTESDEWYYGGYAGYGPLLSMEEDTGLSDKLTRTAVKQCVSEGLLEEQAVESRSGKSRRVEALRVTRLGRETVNAFEAVKPDEIAIIEELFKRHKRELALFVHAEIASERESLGVDAPHNFENVMRLNTVAELDEHITWLRETQGDLLFMIDAIEEQETTKKYRPKTYQ